MNKRWILLTSLVLLGALSRVLPHPPNFTALCALSLLAGSQFEKKYAAFLVPLFALFVSDLFLGFYSGIAWVYFCAALNVFLGFGLRKSQSFWKFTEYSIVSALLFFVTSNFGVWAFGNMYPHTWDGLFSCYVMGIPFLTNMILGNIFFLSVGFFVLRSKSWLLPQTIFCAFFISINLWAAVPQVINIGNGGEPQDLDQHIVTGVPEFHILLNICEGLVDKDPKTLKLLPGAAESWKISPDGKTYTFKIRKDAKWSNGDPVTAKDFEYSVERLLNPKTAAEYAYQAFGLVNAKKYNSGELKDFSKVGVKAKDDYTLVYTLDKPVPYFLELMYHHSFYPVHKATIEKHGKRWTRPENIVTNGAFALQKWEMNKVISLKPNPHYWNKKIVKLTQVNFFPVDQTATEEKMFRAKELHSTETIPNDKIPQWEKDPSKSLHIYPFIGTYFYWLNVRKAPLDNVKVRKALALGIDRQKLIDFVTKGHQAPAQSFTPPGTGGYNPPMLLPKGNGGFAEAKKLMAEAGYPGGKGFPKIEILHNNDTNHRKIAEAIQQMWKENLGITVGINNQEWKVFLDNLQTGNFQIGRMGWIADYNDANNYLDLNLTGGGNNKAGYSNKKYDALIDKAAQEMNPTKRKQYFADAEKILLTDLPVLPIYIYKRIYLMSPTVKGWTDNIQDIHPLKHVYLE